MAIAALIEATAPATAPTSAAPHFSAYATKRTVANDPIYEWWNGPTSDSANRAAWLSQEGGLTSLTIGGKATRTAVQAIPTATTTEITFTAESFDSNDYYDAGSPTRLTVPAGKAGRYLISADLGFLSNATGYRALLLRLNGGTLCWVSQNAVSGFSAFLARSHVATLAAGDYITLACQQTSGADLNTSGTSSLALIYLGT